MEDKKIENEEIEELFPDNEEEIKEENEVKATKKNKKTRKEKKEDRKKNKEDRKKIKKEKKDAKKQEKKLKKENKRKKRTPVDEDNQEEKTVKKKRKFRWSILVIILSFILILVGVFGILVGLDIIPLIKKRGTIYYSLHEKLEVGDYVNYDAGVWKEDKAVPKRNNSFTLGGYTKDASRNKSVTCGYIKEEDNVKSGWRVFSIKDGVVTLIHDGISMCYYHGYGNNTNDKSVNILAGKTEGISFDYFLDEEFGESVKILSKEDIDEFYGSDSSYKRIEDNLIETGIPYWISTKKGTTNMWYVTSGGTVATDQVGMYGIRVLVTLKKETKTTGLNDSKEWILKFEEKKGE